MTMTQKSVSKSELHAIRISFAEIKRYWIEVDHFQDQNRNYIEHPKILGHLTSSLATPRSYSYGLFDRSQLIGVTQLIEWEPEVVRYRTINIRSEYRGQALGSYLLNCAIKKDWSNYKKVFGWVRESHYEWSRRHGFYELDGIWTDSHIAMMKSIDSILAEQV